MAEERTKEKHKKAPVAGAYSMFDTLVVGCRVIDADWKFAYINPAASQHPLWEGIEVLGQPVIQCLPGFEKTSLFPTLARVMETRQTQLLRYPLSGDAKGLGFLELSIQPWDKNSILVVSLYKPSDGKESRMDVTILDSMPECIVVVDLNGIILDTNTRASYMFGYEKEELVGQPIETLIPESRRAAHVKHVAKFASDPAARSMGSGLNLSAVKKDGTEFDVDISLWTGEKEGVSCVYSVIRDISGNRKMENKFKAQIERLTSLREIDLAITNTSDLSMVLRVVLEQTTKELQMDAAAVLLVEPSSPVLMYAAGRGFRDTAIERTRLRIGQGVAGKIVLERKMLRLNDVKHHIPFVREDVMLGDGFVEYYGTPLIVKGRVIGVLEVYKRNKHHADEDWRYFFNTLAGQAAIAIETVRLNEQVQTATIELALAYDATIEGWSKALDLRDGDTLGHTLRVADLTEELAREIGTKSEDVVNIRRGALLHDIGKMGIPDEILKKTGKLTAKEWLIMRRHPTIAYELLNSVEFLRPAIAIPYAHHEKWNGTGYPRGLKGDLIPLEARIFAVVDVWDALTSDRPYRDAWSVEKTMDYIKEEAGSHFDPDIVEAFAHMMKEMKEA